ncbi:MAG: hypothetical protein EOP49_01460 [Sphingobacteriales bacterium]|nr:MAG: hypothetical protein EOP49_01460 [Sphingobacteriales bacterium]
MSRKNYASERMRSLPKLLALLLAFFSLAVNAQDRSSSRTQQKLSAQDLSKSLVKCIDAPQLQKYYRTGGNVINVVQHPIQFPVELKLSPLGNKVNYIADPRTSSKLDSYLIVRDIQSKGNEVKVNANYFYGRNGNAYQLIMVSLIMEKSGQEWVIKNVNIKGNTL